MKKLIVNGVTFKKSRASQDSEYCVGVGVRRGEIIVTNTKSPITFVKFTRQEWEAFIIGVKNGEFDRQELEK